MFYQTAREHHDGLRDCAARGVCGTSRQVVGVSDDPGIVAAQFLAPGLDLIQQAIGNTMTSVRRSHAKVVNVQL